MGERFLIRAATQGDVGFIFATWLRSYKHDSPITAAIHRDLFYKRHQPLLHKLLARHGVEVMVCCDPETPELIFGFIVIERPSTLHWVYVKKPFRLRGVMAELTKACGFKPDLDGCDFTHYTHSAHELYRAGKLKAIYNPYKIFEDDNGRETQGTETAVCEPVRDVGGADSPL